MGGGKLGTQARGSTGLPHLCSGLIQPPAAQTQDKTSRGQLEDHRTGPAPWKVPSLGGEPMRARGQFQWAGLVTERGGASLPGVPPSSPAAWPAELTRASAGPARGERGRRAQHARTFGVLGAWGEVPEVVTAPQENLLPSNSPHASPASFDTFRLGSPKPEALLHILISQPNILSFRRLLPHSKHLPSVSSYHSKSSSPDLLTYTLIHPLPSASSTYTENASPHLPYLYLLLSFLTPYP